MSERKRVLVIEDEHTIRDMVKFILGEAGYEVFGAVNGVEGLKILDSQPVDVVVTDILMPEKEGIETIFAIRKSRPHIKILAVSGGGRTHNFNPLGIAGKIGADETLAKPFQPDALLAAVERVISETSHTKSSAATGSVP